MIVFSLAGYNALAEGIATQLKAQLGQLTMKRFPDGERLLRIDTDPRGQDVAIVAGTINDSATLDIFDLASGLVSDGCRSLYLVIPFFGYSTMERATKKGEVVTAKTRARLLSAIPNAPFGNQVLMLDLHSEGIPFYFEGTVKTRHLYAKSLIMREAQQLAGKDFVLGAVDAGRAKWVESLASDIGVSAGFVYKQRTSDGNVSITGINMPVQGRPVVIYDDMIRSGSSLLQACEAYKAAGAKGINVIATHADFTPDALARIRDSKLISHLIVTDSHTKALQGKDPILKVVSTAGIFADALKEAARAN